MHPFICPILHYPFPIIWQEYHKDGTAHGNIDDLIDGMSPGQEDGNMLVYSVGASIGSSKGYKDSNLDGAPYGN